MVNLKSIAQAYENLKGVVVETPLIYSESLSSMGGGRLYLKCENLQHTGSFKIRGAYNCASQLSAEELKAGLVTGSSGNHGTALSYAAKLLQAKAIIVVPEDVSAAKAEAIQKHGAQVVRCGFTTTERLAKAQEYVKAGMTLIHPYDDERVVSGQGTIGLEIFRQLPEADYIFVPVGGGGLLAGVATAVKELGSKAQVIGVEPELSPRLSLAWQKGEPVELEQWQPSIADGIRTKKSGQIAYEQSKKYVAALVKVGEERIREATRKVVEQTKLWCEPSSAITVAAYLEFSQDLGDKNCVCILSGGNIGLEAMARIIGG